MKYYPNEKEKNKYAEKFGLERGWKLSKTRFSARVLARGGVHEGGMYRKEGALHSSYRDHSWYYRENRRAIAIVSHLYNVPKDISTVADDLGLAVSVRPDLYSWWYPGHTTLVIYTKAN